MTKIPWADVSWNPITGCTPISEGCQNCYAKRMAKRLAGRFGYPKDEPFSVIYHSIATYNKPKHWIKPRRIFVCSMGDLFHNDVPFWWIDDVFEMIRQCQQHIFMILTKRPQSMYNWADSTNARSDDLLGNCPNLWLGVSVELQKHGQRIIDLLKIPAAVRFVSLEPLLEAVDLYFPDILTKGPKYPNDFESWPKDKQDDWFHTAARHTYMASTQTLDWVIAGPETGPGARECKSEWIESLYEQCKAAGVPVFDKRENFIAREFPDNTA